MEFATPTQQQVARYERLAAFCESRVQPAATTAARETWYRLTDRCWQRVCELETR